MHATIGAFIEDMMVVKECQWLHFCIIRELLITVKTILIDIDTAMVWTCHHEFEQQREEVHPSVGGLNRIVESAIGIVVEIEFAVNITPPHYILVHRLLRGIHEFSTHCQIIGVAFLHLGSCLSLSER